MEEEGEDWFFGLFIRLNVSNLASAVSRVEIPYLPKVQCIYPYINSFLEILR